MISSATTSSTSSSASSSSDSLPTPRSVPPSPFDKGVPRPSPEAWPQYPVYVCLR